MSSLNDMLMNLDGALNAGKLSLAIELGTSLVGQHPDSQHGWLSFSEACRLSGDTQKARDAAEKAWLLQPVALFAIAQYARCLIPYADHRLISRLINDAISIEADNEWAFGTLASCAVAIDEWTVALQLYERLLGSNPANPHYRYMQGLALSVLGESDQALEALEKIRQDPDFVGRVLNLIQDIDPGKISQQELEKAIASQRPRASNDAVYALQALGRLHHAHRSFTDAFSCWQRANDLKCATVKYRPDEWQVFADQIMKLIEPGGRSDTRPELVDKAPIFIVGLPRSGTTLLERILVNSGKVAALGELRDFEVLLQMHQGLPVTPMPFAIKRDAVERLDWQLIGKAYQDRIASRDASSRRPCDKNPFNFLFSGLILSAMPEAQIIHIKKHPMDAGLGNFRHIFAAAAPWSYRLDDIAHFYSLYEKVMAYWAAMFPDQIYQIYYDDLVSAPPAQSEKLFEWLNLPWKEDVLNTSGRGGIVRSASANQVRAPIHKQSVQVWRNYVPELTPLHDALVRAGIIQTQE